MRDQRKPPGVANTPGGGVCLEAKNDNDKTDHNIRRRLARALARRQLSETVAAELTSAGFHVTRHNAGLHLIAVGYGLRFNYWPSAHKWMIFGRVWQSSVKAVIQGISQGRIRMSDDAQQSECRRCGATIWWAGTNRGRWIPVEADGDSHVGRCQP
jgi:hypothetical protein